MYVGLTENQFKTRYANHKASFSNIQKQNRTELSKHIWNLKQKNIEYESIDGLHLTSWRPCWR